MEKKTTNLFLIAVIVIATSFLMPIIGITAETDNTTNIQWEPCCSSEDNEKENSNTLSIPVIGINQYFTY